MSDSVRRCTDCGQAVDPLSSDFDALGYFVCPFCGSTAGRPTAERRSDQPADETATEGFDWVRFHDR